VLSVHGRANLIAFESQHARKRLRDAFIVVYDQDFRCCGICPQRSH
jgi:hypothetical protein